MNQLFMNQLFMNQLFMNQLFMNQGLRTRLQTQNRQPDRFFRPAVSIFELAATSE
jgi:hypothetical protein